VESFYGGRTRILTELRNQYGPAFRDAYKRSIELTKILEMENLEKSNIELRNIPEQRSSPIYAKVEFQKIVLDEGSASHPLLRKEALTQTKMYLGQELDELGGALERSNVDKRFVHAFRKIRTLIDFEDDAGAINLGLQARAVGQMVKSVEQELSDVLVLQISSTLTHTSYFASQYQDWVNFVRNARDYPARAVVDNAIDRALEDMNRTLSSYPDSVDSRIPESIRFISALLGGDPVDRQNAIYAGVRGFENICIVAARFAYEQAVFYLRDSGSKARPTLVKVGAAVIVALTLSIVADFMPVITKAPELSWILENLPRLERINQIFK
jgi:hypothetical protein